jgi:hypothetical protein
MPKTTEAADHAWASYISKLEETGDLLALWHPLHALQLQLEAQGIHSGELYTCIIGARTELQRDLAAEFRDLEAIYNEYCALDDASQQEEA